jgi:hypothetical protein
MWRKCQNKRWLMDCSAHEKWRKCQNKATVDGTVWKESEKSPFLNCLCDLFVLFAL